MADQGTFITGVTLALDKVHGWSNGFFSLLPNMIAGIVFLLLFLVLAYAFSRGIRTYFTRNDRRDLGQILAGFGYWLIIVFGVLVALTIIVPSLRPVDLLASLGLGSLAIGFAFKDILQNWFAGLLILLRLPFRRGDQISIGEAEGTVIRIEPRATIIRTYDGRDIIVPNTTIYTGTVFVHTAQKIRRVEIDFTVGYGYSIREITGIVQQALAQIDEILTDPPSQVFCWELGATSLAMKVRWWINSDRSQEIVSRARAVQAIKEAFDSNDIDPTDPQLIYYRVAATAPDAEGTAHGPPPAVPFSPSDPEAERPKIDSKDRTLLS